MRGVLAEQTVRRLNEQICETCAVVVEAMRAITRESVRPSEQGSAATGRPQVSLLAWHANHSGLIAGTTRAERTIQRLSWRVIPITTSRPST
jgi:hypothetical protein